MAEVMSTPLPSEAELREIQKTKALEEAEPVTDEASAAKALETATDKGAYTFEHIYAKFKNHVKALSKKDVQNLAEAIIVYPYEDKARIDAWLQRTNPVAKEAFLLGIRLIETKSAFMLSAAMMAEQSKMDSSGEPALVEKTESLEKKDEA